MPGRDIVLLVTCTLILCTGLTLAQESEPAKPKVLACTVVHEAQSAVKLRLIMQSVPPVPLEARLSKQGRGNLALMLVSSPENDESKSELLWITYATASLPSTPLPIWSGTISVAPSGKKALLAICHSRASEAELRAAIVDLDKPISKYPVKFVPAEFKTWPDSSVPVYTTNFNLTRGNSITYVQAIFTEQRNLVCVGSDKEKERLWTVDPATGQWTLADPGSGRGQAPKSE